MLSLYLIADLRCVVVPAQVFSNLAGPKERVTFPKQISSFVLAGGGERKGEKIEGKPRQMLGAGGKDTDKPEKQGVAL